MPTLCKLLFTFTLIVFLNSFSFAQTLPELEKVKEIKLLEHTRDDVRRILAEYKLIPSEKQNYEDNFETENAEIEISYSEGNCQKQDGEIYGLEVKKDKVVQIIITPKNETLLKTLNVQLSKFKKENTYTNYDKAKTYHNKDLGIAIFTFGNVIRLISIEPSKKYYFLACNKEKAKLALKSSSYYSPEDKVRNYHYGLPNSIPNVENLILSFDEITANCSDSENKSCSDNVKVIAIFTYAKDLDHDTLIYKYDVSGGRILPFDNKPIDRSEKVLWDLSDVKPGTYTITAAVDDGCGFCGKTMTKTVTVKECLDCNKP